MLNIIFFITVLFISYIMFVLLNEYRKFKLKTIKYNLYSLRDDFTRLVIKGKLEQNSNEHIAICNSINYAINHTDDINLYKLIKLISIEDSNNSLEEKNDISSVAMKIDNKDVALIVYNYFVQIVEILKVNNRFEVHIVKFLGSVFQKSTNESIHNIDLKGAKALKNIENNKNYLRTIIA